MSIYHKDVIYIAPNETILLKFVESFSFGADSEQDVVDKLKDDYCFYVRTISGKEYTVSAKLMQETIKYTMPHKEFAQSVYSKWLWINKS
jgi:hypothetical protein